MFRLTIQLYDEMTIISATHAPFISGYNESVIGYENNPYGVGGQFRTVCIDYVMKVNAIVTIMAPKISPAAPTMQFTPRN